MNYVANKASNPYTNSPNDVSFYNLTLLISTHTHTDFFLLYKP